MKSKITKAISGGAGAIIIAGLMLGGNDGLEGRRYVPYYDVAHVLTVCDGHTGRDIIKNKRYTDFECDTLLANDLKAVATAIDPMITVPIPEQTRAALYSFTYNVGVSAFQKSTLLQLLNAGQTAQACNELHRWIYAGGKVWKGLINRREIEFMVCTYQDDERERATKQAELEAIERAQEPTGHPWMWRMVIGSIALFSLLVSAVIWFTRKRG